MVTRTEQLPEDRPQPGVLSASISTTDSNRWITALALGGLTAATILSVAGGTPFDLPMPTHAIGLVTPTCGLTRGSTALVGGDAALAWRYNPASVVVVAFGVFGLARAVVGFTTKRWLDISVRLTTTARFVLVIAFVVLWIYQQGNAEFVMNARP